MIVDRLRDGAAYYAHAIGNAQTSPLSSNSLMFRLAKQQCCAVLRKNKMGTRISIARSGCIIRRLAKTATYRGSRRRNAMACASENLKDQKEMSFSKPCMAALAR